MKIALHQFADFSLSLFRKLILLPVLFLLFLSFGKLAAQSITFSGSTTDFTGQGITALAAATGAVTYYSSSDGTYMYFGAFRTGGSTWGSTDHFTIYIDADPRSAPTTAGNGSTGGLAWDNQTPTMPFRADYRIAVRTDGATGSGSGSSFYHSNSTTSGTANWSATTAANAKGYSQYVSNASNGGIEIRVPLSDFGNPASTYVSMYASYSGSGGGFFAPATGSFTGSSLSGYIRNLGIYKNNNITNGTATTPITDLSVSSGSTLTAGDYGDINLTNANTYALSGNTSFSGTLSIGTGTTLATRVGLSTFTLFAGGRGAGGTAGQLAVNGSSGAPITTGTGGTFSFLGAGLVSGTSGAASLTIFPSSSTVTIGGTVDFGNVGGVTLKSGLSGTLQINSGGSINTNPPTYGSASTLIYNTGGTYGAGAEWTTNSATAKGVPQIVTIQNNTAVNFGTSALYRQANGLVTIGSGSSLTLSSVSGGDLRIAGGLTNSNAANNTGFNTNGRALQTMGTGTYTKNGTTGGTDSLDFLIIGSTNQFNIADKTNLNLTNTNSSGCLQWNSTGAIFLGGTNTISIVAGGTVGGSSAGSLGGSSPTTSILNLAGTTTWNTGGVITVSTNVGIQVNAGLTISTAGRLSAGYLQINPGGFIGGTNPIVYPASGTLVYNHSSGTYGVQALEFPGTSGPVNLTINANGASTGISFSNNAIGARTLTGTLTLNQNLDLSGAGAALTTLNTVANATATVGGTGTFTHSASGSFTTANAAGINGTLTTSGAKTLPTTTNFVFNNATTSQVTGALLPATINNLTINNPTASTGTTISNNTLVISGTTALTAGALVLPTGASNLVTFTGAISAVTGTLTGSTTANVSTANVSTNLGFTAGGRNLNNWSVNADFGTSAPLGLNTSLTINGTLTQVGASDIWTTSSGSLTIAPNAIYDELANGWYRGAGALTISSGAIFKINDSGGLMADASAGAVRASGTLSFNGAANYTFNNASTQAIGTAIDSGGGIGKTGPITGNVNVTGGSGQNLTLNSGTIITINTPGTFNMGILNTSGTTVTAPATSIINGTGTINMFGNGATNGSTLVTAHANGVNGTFATTTTNLTNGANNNTNFTFNGAALAQVTGSLLPSTINNLTINNATAGTATATPAVLLSASTTIGGTLTFTAGHFSINGQTLTANGAITITTAQRLVGTSSSNFIVGGSGAIGGSSLFGTSGGGALNNFTINRASSVIVAGTPVTVSGTLSLSNGALSMAANTLTLNGAISLGSGTLTAASTPLVIGGSGAITGTLVATSTPLAFSGITMNRTGATLTLGSNATVSNATGLTLTAGYIALGAFNLTNTNTAGTLGTGSANAMIVATSTGQAFLSMPIGASTKTFPIGDGTNYTPTTLTFTANATTGTIGARVTAAGHPQKDNSGTQNNYLNRYWSFTTTGLTTYTYTSAFNYVPGDIVGTEGTIKLNRWSGTAWTEDATSAASSNVLTSTTGLTNASFPLSADYTGRKEFIAIDYVWNGSASNNWDTEANWTPSGIPAALDNVTVNIPGSNTNCSINSGAKTVSTFTLNGTGAFAMASGTSLTVSGAVTYAGTSGATASLDCASTFAMNSSSSQNIPALNYGNLNLSGGNRTLASAAIGICGIFTPGAGTIITTGNTINFNGSGSQTIPAFNYNNLTSSSSGARTLASSGTIGVGGTFTPGTNSYTVTGSTVNFNGTSAQTIAASIYNNLTISGARGTAIITLASGTIGVSGTFNPSATGTITYVSTGNTFDYTSTSSQTIVGFNRYNNLSNSGNGTRTLSSAANIVIDGVYTPTTGTVNVGTSTIDFSSASSQTMPGTFYYSITNSGNGPRILASSGIIDINFAFTPTSGITTITGSTVRYSDLTAGPWALSTFTTNVTNRQYNNLILVGGSSTSWSPGVGYNLGVAGNFSLTGSGTFNVCANSTANTVTVDGNFEVGPSSGKVNVTSSSGAGTLNVTGNFKQLGTGTITVSGGTGLGIANITGNMEISSGTINGNAATTTSKNAEIFVGGTYLQTGGTVNLQNNTSSSATTATYGFMEVTGDFTLTAGTFEFATTSVNTLSGNYGELDLKGNFIRNGSANTLKATGSGYNGEIYFIGNTPQTINVSTTTATTNYISTIIWTGANVSLLSNYKASAVTVNSGGTLACGLNLIQDANTVCNFTNNGTLGIGSTNGIVSGTTLSGNIQCTGTRTFAITGNYIYNGSTGQTTGSGLPATVNNLTINNSGADVKLSQGVTVNGNLTFISGNLDLNGSNNITLGNTSGAIVNETNAARIINTSAPSATNGWIGVVSKSLAANPGNVANLGMNITVASAMGNTTIKRFPRAVSGIPNALNSISRVYAIQPTTASSASTITLNYFDGELNSNTETSPTLVFYNSTGANETTAVSYNYTGASATDGSANTVTLNTANLTTTNTFWTALNTDKFFTAQAGDWNDTATWTTGVVPPASSAPNVLHAVTVNATVTAVPASVTVTTGGSLAFGNSGALTVGTTFTNGGSGITMTDGGTLTMNSGATFANGTNTFTGGSGTVAFAGTGTISGTIGFNNLALNGATTLPATVTVNGNLIFNATAASVTNAPTYGASSNLIYAANVSRGGEWSATSPGAGYPVNVIVQNGATLTANQSFDVGCSGYLQLGSTGSAGSINMVGAGKIIVAGNVIIGSNSGTSTLALSNTIGGDIKVGGNWTRSSNGAFTPNGRAVFFTGSGTNVINSTGGASFDYLVSEKAAGAMQLGSNLSVNAPSGGNALSLKSAASFALNGYTLNLTNANSSNVQADGGTVNFTGTGTINFANSTITFTQSNSGSFAFGSNVALTTSTGVNFGAGLSTINGTFQINGGGFVQINAPIYSSTSTLIYNSNYGRNLEWSATSGAGYPNNVVVIGGSTLDLSANGFADRALAGDLTLGVVGGTSGSLSMGATTNRLTVGGNIIVGGNTAGTSTLTLSSAVGGDIYINGNWSRNTGGSFVTNSRAVFFQGTGTSMITTITTASFDYLFINKTSTGKVVLANDMTVNNNLTFSSGNTGVIQTDNFKVIVPTTATITRTGSGHINGNLRRFVPTGTVTGFNLPIGDATNYSPAAINFAGTVSWAGYLDASVSIPGAAPSVASGLSQNKYVDRKWTITNTGVGGFTSFAPTFTFVAADIQGSASTSLFSIRNLNGSTWSNTTLGAALSASTSASGVTSFGDYLIGESAGIAVATQPTTANVCTGSDSSFVATSSSLPTPTVKWQRSIDGGASWADITAGLDAGTIYSNFTTDTLNLTGTTTGLNGYKYRVVYTNINGNSTNSNEVALIVSGASVGGSITGNQSVCPNSEPASLTLTSNVGSVVKWQSASNTAFTGATDIVSTSSTLNGATIGNVAATTYFRAVVQNGACSVSNSAYATVSVNAVTTWTSTGWDNGAPTSTTPAKIAYDYSVATDLSACSLIIDNGAVVSVPTNFDFNISGIVDVQSGSLTVQNNANLIQSGVTNNNSGDITCKRINSSMRRLDYTYWSSPTAKSTYSLKNFSPLTMSLTSTPQGGASRFYTLSESGNAFAVVDPLATYFDSSNIAKGFSIRAPNNFPTNGSLGTFNANFIGIPNNGTITVPVTYSGSGKGNNLIGNPYPSGFDALAFLQYTPDSGSTYPNAGTMYFWTHTTQGGGSSNYASFNLFGGTASSLGGSTPNGTVQVGQGFLLKKATNATVVFTNSMRVGNNQGQFFRTATTERHRIWLNLAADTIPVNQILVGYVEGATLGFDDSYDGKLINNASSISSIIDNENYVIQARPTPFVNTDEVPLSFNATTAGSYTLSLDHVDGLFLGEQNVYLKDNLLNVTHDIKTSAYTFTSDQGTFSDRFEVVYINSTLNISTPTFDANSVIVYKDDNKVLNINAGKVVMKNVKIYDVRGRFVYEKSNINSTTTALKDLKAEQEVLLVKITSDDNKVVTKKVVF